ncbi:MAG: glycosyltransferase family 87 protein, partial [Vicinamibacterales bacterium]
DTRAQWEYQRPIIQANRIEWGDRVMHPFIAPPVLGVAVMPLLVFSPSVAYLIWAALNAVAVATGLWLLARRLLLHWSVPLVVVAGSMPLFMVIMLGQVEGLLFLAFVIVILQLQSGHQVRAGLALVLFVIKPPLLLAPLLYLTLTGQRRAAWTTVVGAGTLALSSMLLVGVKGINDFVALSQRLSGPDGSVVTNVWGMVNIRSVVVRALPADEGLLIDVMIVVLTGATLAATGWFWRRSGVDAVGLPSVALLAVTTVLTAYHALYHATILALLAVVLMAAHAIHGGEPRRSDWFVASSWAVFSVLPLVMFVIVQSSKAPAAIGVAGLMLLWGFAAGAVAQEAVEAETASQPARTDLRPWYVILRD